MTPLTPLESWGLLIILVVIFLSIVYLATNPARKRRKRIDDSVRGITQLHKPLDW